MSNLIERDQERIGVLGCFDRVLVRGTHLRCAMRRRWRLDSRGIRLFDYAKQFAELSREAIRRHAERVAAGAGIEVEYIKRPKGFRKEDRIREILEKRRALSLSWRRSRFPQV